jgi:hypothetical protein
MFPAESFEADVRIEFQNLMGNAISRIIFCRYEHPIHYSNNIFSRVVGY